MMCVLEVDDVCVELRPDVGGRIGQITVDDRRLLRGEDEAAGGWPFWGAYPLAPWSNRVADGQFRFGEELHRLPVNWSDGSALHGLVASVEWSVSASSATTAVLAVEVDQPPFVLECRQEVTLAPDRLDVTLSCCNRADGAVPVGLGIHPWFHAGPLRVPADLVWPAVDAIPTGPPRAVSQAEDLREARVPPLLDDCYTGLTDCRASVGDVTIEWAPESLVRHVVVFTGEPGWVCVEPVTNANNGFNLAADGIEGHGVVVVSPGDEVAATFSFLWSVPS